MIQLKRLDFKTCKKNKKRLPVPEGVNKRYREPGAKSMKLF
jgi:hypothetical protein